MSGHKRSVTIRGHRTSVSVEPEFWDALSEIAQNDRQSMGDIVAMIDSARGRDGLSSAIRLYVLKRLREVAVRSRRPDA